MLHHSGGGVGAASQPLTGSLATHTHAQTRTHEYEQTRTRGKIDRQTDAHTHTHGGTEDETQRDRVKERETVWRDGNQQYCGNHNVGRSKQQHTDAQKAR